MVGKTLQVIEVMHMSYIKTIWKDEEHNMKDRFNRDEMFYKIADINIPMKEKKMMF